MSNKLKPVSIIIPIRNRGNFVSKLIENLMQLDYPQFEIIIIDDCSTDNTKNQLKDYPVRTLSLEKSVGSAEARNIGIKIAKNDIIALTDSDCIVSKTWLKDLVPFLEDYDIVGGKVIYCNKQEKKLHPFIMKTETLIENKSDVNFLNTNNMIFKKELINSVGGFLNYRLEDLEFSWRALRKGFKLIYVPKGNIIHYDNRNPLQNIKKYLLYGKSYSKISYIHKMDLSFKTEPILSRKSFQKYIQLFVLPIIILFSFYIYSTLISSNILYVLLLMLHIAISVLIIYRLIKGIDIFYIIYKNCIFISILSYMLIYMVKTEKKQGI